MPDGRPAVGGARPERPGSARPERLLRRVPRAQGRLAGHSAQRDHGASSARRAAASRTLLRSLNRMNDLIPERARSRARSCSTARTSTRAGVDPVELRRRVGMVFQKPNPFPKTIYENVAYGPRINGLRDRASWTSMVERSPAAGGPVGRGQGPAASRARSSCPAASSSACASPARWRSSPRCCCMDEPASALDPIATAQDRGADLRAAARLHDRHRDAQHAAGGARLRPHGVHSTRAA